MSLMNTDAGIPSQVLAKPIQWLIKMITHQDQAGFISGIQGWFRICKSVSVTQHINRKKKIVWSSQLMCKNVDKIQHPFVIKNVDKLHIEWMYHSVIKAKYGQPITLNSKTQEVFL